MASNGVNSIIIGGNEHHYLYNSLMKGHDEKYLEPEEKVVKLCHEKGIKVIEHHSSSLMSPKMATSKIAHMLQLGFDDNCKPVVKLQDFYDTRSFCPNNMEFRDFYFKELCKIMDRIPFDGIMSDDASLLGGCCCAVCSKKWADENKSVIGEAFLAVKNGDRGQIWRHGASPASAG